MNKIRTHTDLDVFQSSYSLALEIFVISKDFPSEERYSLTDQIRRSSRSVAANLAEAFRKRRYEKAFIAKLNDVESEVAETQVWLNFARDFNYLEKEVHDNLYNKYNSIQGQVIRMIKTSQHWII